MLLVMVNREPGLSISFGLVEGVLPFAGMVDQMAIIARVFIIVTFSQKSS